MNIKRVHTITVTFSLPEIIAALKVATSGRLEVAAMNSLGKGVTPTMSPQGTLSLTYSKGDEPVTTTPVGYRMGELTDDCA